MNKDDLAPLARSTGAAALVGAGGAGLLLGAFWILHAASQAGIAPSTRLSVMIVAPLGALIGWLVSVVAVRVAGFCGEVLWGPVLLAALISWYGSQQLGSVLGSSGGARFDWLAGLGGAIIATVGMIHVSLERFR